MEVKPALALPDGLDLIEIEKMDEILTILVASTQESPCCPCCGQPATRVHSRYTRQAADLPCGGQYLRLILHVRKFFCGETTCPRKIFVERLTPFIRPWARVTLRLLETPYRSPQQPLWETETIMTSSTTLARLRSTTPPKASYTLCAASLAQ